MLWRLTRAEFERRKGTGTKRALRRLVGRGDPPGVLAYVGDVAVGWCAIGPRETYPALERSRIMRPPDAARVWCVTCFYVAPRFRRRGLSVQLLRAAVTFAGRRGARVVEGYPILPSRSDYPPAFASIWLAGTFSCAGFRQVAQPSPTRLIVRHSVRRS